MCHSVSEPENQSQGGLDEETEVQATDTQEQETNMEQQKLPQTSEQV